MLPSIARWLGSGGSRRLTFHLTQALSGHGCFDSYVHKIGKAESPNCWWCPDDVDDPAHTLFACDQFASERREVNRLLGKAVAPTDVDSILCDDHRVALLTNVVLRNTVRRDEEAVRKEFLGMVEAILTHKEAVERTRQAEARANRATGLSR